VVVVVVVYFAHSKITSKITNLAICYKNYNQSLFLFGFSVVL